MGEIEVEDLAAAFATEPPAILDVRESWEFALCSLAGAQHIPLGELPARLAELDRERELVVICHHGIRSRAAQTYLLAQGFPHVMNLSGGIDAWARRIDPAMAVY
jgi:rhodanese-related sulfurtransferase